MGDSRRVIPQGQGEIAGAVVQKVERDGGLVLPRGWASSWELRVAVIVAHVWSLPIRYESGGRVPLAALMRGLLGKGLLR